MLLQRQQPKASSIDQYDVVIFRSRCTRITTPICLFRRDHSLVGSHDTNIVDISVKCFDCSKQNILYSLLSLQKYSWEVGILSLFIRLKQVCTDLLFRLNRCNIIILVVLALAYCISVQVDCHPCKMFL